MKKISIAIVALAFVALATAANATYSRNLSVGSTGTDVADLQTLLISKGHNIPAIAAGTAKGYFGSQTVAAVKLYQAENGVPSTGFVGPLTLAKLNGSAPVANLLTIPFPCPTGYTAPAGWVCPGGAAVVTPGTPVLTTGIPGSLVYSLQSTFANSTLDKGKSVDVAKYKLQASASDMQVTSVSFDVNKRLWLYVSGVTVKDDAGTVVASKTGLTASDFSELTVGSSYRLTLPVSYVVPRATSKYFTVNLTALSVTDRTTSDTIVISSSQARAVDGTGVNDTQTEGTDRNISWTGSSNAAIVTTINSASPATKLVQVSTSVETDNVVLGVFDVKSQNTDTTLRTLKVAVRSSGALVSALFNDIKLKIGGNTYSADGIDSASPNTTSSTTVTFTNLDMTLVKDTYVPVTILAKVAKNVAGSASTTLFANATNIVVEDSSYASVSVNSAEITANTQTFTTSGVVATGLTVTQESPIVPQNNTISRIAHVKYTLTAGDNAIYISKTQDVAISTSSVLTLATTTSTGLSVDNTNGDTGTYFYIAPGQSKTFTADYKTVGSSATGSGSVLQVTSLNYGISSGGAFTTPLTSSDLQSALKVTFF